MELFGSIIILTSIATAITALAVAIVAAFFTK